MRSRLRIAGLLLGSIALFLQAPPTQVGSATSATTATPAGPGSPATLAIAPSAPLTSAKSWATRHGMKMNSQHAGGAVLRGRFYVVGGQVYHEPLRLVQAYNPANNRWKLRARLPAARMDVAAVAAGTRLYAVGGASPSLMPTKTLYSYNPRSNKWVSRAPMPASLSGVAAASADNGGRTDIFAFGGADGAGAAVATTSIYDTRTDSWVAGQALPSAIAYAQAVRVGGSIYVLGGLDSTGQPSLSVYIYDVASNTFTVGAPMAMNSFGLIGATAGSDGRIYAVGLDWSATRVDAYNPVADAWTGSPPNLLHPQAYPAMGSIGNRIYAAGGNPANLTITSDTLEALKVT
jgi:hypothetical protein